ncbi:hypothetical protein K438DRAFT_1982694 [Mycena galopus ATCC 62051]|nr:hypothetical protein K438DRAFT_1982694 [Mycena galopus ATCC 62051]
MSSILHGFALAWNSGLRFFLDSLYSPLPGLLYPPLEPEILGSPLSPPVVWSTRTVSSLGYSTFGALQSAGFLAMALVMDLADKLGMESALLCLNHHGAWVSWSSRYERLMHHLLPGALEHVPLPERLAELAHLRALPLFVSYPPDHYGMTPLDWMGAASLRISDFDLRRLSAVSTSFSSEATASSGFVEEEGISVHILSGADLDVFIAEHCWNLDEFLDSTPASALSVPQVLCDLVPLIGRDLRAPLSALSTPRVGVAPLPIGYAFWIFLPWTHCPPELRAVATHVNDAM